MVSLRAFGGSRRLLLLTISLCLALYYLPSAFRVYSGGYVAQKSYKGRRDPPVLGCPAEGDKAPERRLTLNTTRANAAIFLLARDGDLKELVPTLHNFEDTFNAKFRYPYVFLNDAAFSSSFQKGIRDALPADAVVEFGLIPQEDWSIPEWLDKQEITKGFTQMKEQGIQYADREGYHHMCRFYSGLFALQPIMLKYDYYWRLEPGGECRWSITHGSSP